MPKCEPSEKKIIQNKALNLDSLITFFSLKKFYQLRNDNVFLKLFARFVTQYKAEAEPGLSAFNDMKSIFGL